jgi:antimicrobial peptide system SdpB family protein
VLGVARALAFEPRATALGVSRSLLAVAGISVIALTPDADLFPLVPDGPVGPRCDGLRALSLWCVGSGEVALTLSRFLSVAVLMVVASGYRPRWTCVPHWYVTFSLGAAMHVPNGGEHVARILTLLLIPICLGDDRIWQWRRPEIPLPAWWRGAAYAGHLTIRVQVALVYGQAVWIKLREAEWRDGTAMHYVFQDPYFGTWPELATFVESGLLTDWFILAITWGTIAVESAITLSAFGNTAVRRCAVVLGIVLHVGIIATLGLFSFGLVMIGLLFAASSGTDSGRSVDRVPPNGGMVSRRAEPQP